MYRSILTVPLLLVLLLGTQNAWALPEIADSPTVSRYPPHVQTLFTKLKALADTADLSNPAIVGEQLELKLQAETKELIPQPAVCSGDTGFRSMEHTEVKVVGDSWYRPMLGGVPDMPIPAAFINRASHAGQPALIYFIKHTISCTDRYSLVEQTNAALTLSGLPSFACLSVDDVEVLLPGSEFIMATDGVSLVRYQGRLDDDVRVDMDVNFRMGARCALGVTVRQSQSDGLRNQRAESKRENCGVQVTRAFCKKHKAFGLGDIAKQNELYDAISATCGTIDQLVKSDTEHGTLPKPRPKLKAGAEPCHIYDE